MLALLKRRVALHVYFIEAGSVRTVPMKRIIGVACVMALSCGYSIGQTNASPQTKLNFLLPPVRLSLEFNSAADKPAEFEQQVVETKPEPSLHSTSVQNVEVQYVVLDSDLHTRLLKPGEFYLGTPRLRPNSGTMRFVDDVFTPEYIHWGKTSVQCPFVTVIRRKNPLSFLSSFATGDGLLKCKLFELSW
jgi:hypothetical protein